MILDRVRATLRDPLYRHERRQARALASGWGIFFGLAGAAVAGCCCLGGAVIYGFSALWTAESLLGERDHDTIEQLLLTPAGRERVLWAKLLARMRPFVWVAVFLPLVGLIGGLFQGASLGEAPRSGVLYMACGAAAGLGLGALVGVFLVGQSLTCGAIGMHAVLYGRSRRMSYLLALVFVYALGIADSMVGMMIYIPAMIATAAGSAWNDTGFLVGGIVVAVGWSLALLIGRFYLINVWLPIKLVERAAGSMDEALLRDS